MARGADDDMLRGHSAAGASKWPPHSPIFAPRFALVGSPHQRAAVRGRSPRLEMAPALPHLCASGSPCGLTAPTCSRARSISEARNGPRPPPFLRLGSPLRAHRTSEQPCEVDLRGSKWPPHSPIFAPRFALVGSPHQRAAVRG